MLAASLRRAAAVARRGLIPGAPPAPPTIVFGQRRGCCSMPTPPAAAAAAAADAPHPQRVSNAADPADAATADALASGSPPPPEEWLRTARQGLDDPITWHDLRALLRAWRARVRAGGGPDAAAPLGRMGRSRETTAAYRAHRARVLDEWETMSDYAAVVILGWCDKEADADGRTTTTKGRAGPRRQLVGAGSKSGVFTPNDFPYYFEPGVQHELLWSPTGPMSDDAIEKTVRRRLRQLYGTGDDGGGGGSSGAADGSGDDDDDDQGQGLVRARGVGEAVWWVNPVELKSVPEIWHAHVVLRKEEQ
jgi:hypothetical protein